MKMKIVDGNYKLESLGKNVGIPLEDYVSSKELEDGIRPGMLEILANDNPSKKIVNAYNMVFAYRGLKYRDPIGLYEALSLCSTDLVNTFLTFKKATKQSVVYFLLQILFGENQLKLMYERADEFKARIESRNRLHALMTLVENRVTASNYIDSPKTRLAILERYFINRKVCEGLGGFSFRNYTVGDRSLKDLVNVTCRSYRLIGLKIEMDQEITDDNWSTFFDYFSEVVGKIRKRTSIKHLNAINAVTRESIRYLKRIENEKYLKRVKKEYNKFRVKIHKHKLRL